jgi:LPS-assembly lipoprotein
MRGAGDRRGERWHGTWRAALACGLVLGLAACGFHLRGSRGEFKSLPPIYVRGEDPAVIDLRQFLRVGGSPVVDEPAQARMIVTVLDARRDRRVLSVGTRGRVEEYELRYELPFYVDDAAGHRLLDQQAAVQTRNFSFDETDVIAKSNEEEYLFRDMQRNAVMQIMRRLPPLGEALRAREAAPPAEQGARPGGETPAPSGTPGE